MGTSRRPKVYVESILIPQLSSSNQGPFVRLVEQTIEAKDPHFNAQASELEQEIDQLVYELFGLTEGEVTAIECLMGLIYATEEGEDAGLAR